MLISCFVVLSFFIRLPQILCGFPGGGTTPDPDKDNDGLFYFDENIYGTSDYDADCDNDGWNDYQECVVWGTDPWDPANNPDTLPIDIALLFNCMGDPTFVDRDGLKTIGDNLKSAGLIQQYVYWECGEIRDGIEFSQTVFKDEIIKYGTDPKYSIKYFGLYSHTNGEYWSTQFESEPGVADLGKGQKIESGQNLPDIEDWCDTYEDYECDPIFSVDPAKYNYYDLGDYLRISDCLDNVDLSECVATIFGCNSYGSDDSTDNDDLYRNDLGHSMRDMWVHDFGVKAFVGPLSGTYQVSNGNPDIFAEAFYNYLIDHQSLLSSNFNLCLKNAVGITSDVTTSVNWAIEFSDGTEFGV